MGRGPGGASAKDPRQATNDDGTVDPRGVGSVSPDQIRLPERRTRKTGNETRERERGNESTRKRGWGRKTGNAGNGTNGEHKRRMARRKICPAEDIAGGTLPATRPAANEANGGNGRPRPGHRAVVLPGVRRPARLSGWSGAAWTRDGQMTGSSGQRSGSGGTWDLLPDQTGGARPEPGGAARTGHDGAHRESRGAAPGGPRRLEQETRRAQDGVAQALLLVVLCGGGGEGGSHISDRPTPALDWCVSTRTRRRAARGSGDIPPPSPPIEHATAGDSTTLRRTSPSWGIYLPSPLSRSPIASHRP